MPAAFASLLFDSPEHPLIGQTQSFATFPPFRARARSFFRIFRYSPIWFLLLFSSPTLSTCALPYHHIVGSLTSTIPSTAHALHEAWKIIAAKMILLREYSIM
jgi:hypothetical protein